MSGTTSTPASETPTPPKKAKKRRTWRQRLKIAAIVLIVGVIVVRIGLNLLLPTVVRQVAGAYDLDCTFDRMSLGILGGNAHIWGLELRPRSGGDSIIQAEYIQGSISTPNLLRGRLVVYRAEVDGVDMLIEREADGSIPLLQRLLSAPEDAPISVEPEPAETTPGEPINLQPPLRIDAVRLSHVTTTFRDRSVTPTFETTLRTSLRISDVGSTAPQDGQEPAPARFEIQVQADPILDTFAINGILRGTPTTIDADVDLLLRGLHPKAAAVYLTPLGLRPVAEDITVTARANLSASVIADSTDVAATLTISDILAEVDYAEWASLKTISLDVKRANPNAIELGQLLIETGRATAQRTDAGLIRVAGFELIPPDNASPVPASAAPSPAPAAQPVDTAPAAPIRISLDEFRLADLQAKFADQATQPAAELIARLDHLSARNIVIDPSDRDSVVSLDGAAALPGVVQAITWDGTATPFADQRQAALQFRAAGIRPDALKPYLLPIGVESTFTDGVFTADLSADVGESAAVRLSNIRLADGDTTMMELASATIAGASVDPDDGAIHVASIEITGPAITIRRDQTGALAAFGLRTIAPVGKVASSQVPPAAATGKQPATASGNSPVDAAPLNLPRMRIDRYTWDNIQFNFEDHFNVDTPVVLEGRAGVSVTDFVFDSAATQTTDQPGRIAAWLSLPGVAERLAIDGSVQTTPQGVKIASTLSGEGLTGRAIASYLKPLGIEITLENGRLQGRAAAAIANRDDALRADLELADIVYSDGGQELAGVGVVRVSGLSLAPAGIAIDLVQITQPRAAVARTADGAIEAAGIRLIAQPPAPESAAPQPPTPAGPPASLVLTPAPIDLTLAQLRIEQAALHLTDHAVDPVLQTALRGDVTLDNLRTKQADAPARLAVSGAIDGIIEKASVTGTLSLATDAPAANLTVTAEAINGDSLAGYLPPGISTTLRDGRFAMKLDAALANHADGGLAGHLAVRELLLHAQSVDATLAKVGAFVVRFDRIDPAGGVIAIDEISSEGVALDIARQPDGALDALGLRLGTATQSPAIDPAAAPDPAAAEDAAAPAVAVAAPAPAQPPADVAAMVADARRALPLLTVNTIDLKLDRLRISGLTTPDGAPVDLAGFRLYSPDPIELAGENPDDRPPLRLRIEGAVDPVMREVAVALEATPFNTEPQLTVDLNVSGINGRGLTDIAPELKNVIDGDGLTEGTFITRLVASLNYGRRGPRDLDIARGFTATFEITPVAFRGQPDGPVLAGLESIQGEGIQVQPRNGNVVIKSIEVVRPIGRIVQDEQGLHALGLVIPLKQSESAVPPQPQDEALPVAADPASPAPVAGGSAAQPPQRPTSEFRLDRFTVTGIDLVFEDRTASPHTVVPLKSLDLEVRDVSNQMLWTGKPVRFDMLCTADEVPLPPRRGAAASPDASADGLEPRALFSQITANGRIGMKQNQRGETHLTGWAKTSVSGFELLGVRGLAETQKIIIGGGVFDDSNDIRFKDDGTIETRNRIVFTNLSLSEPPGGPIQRTLQLPAPIDVALGALTDPDGSITLNLPVTIESGAVDVGKLIAPALGAVTQVMVTAIASAPMKAVGGVGDLIGLGGRGGSQPEPPIELTFMSGVAALEPAQARQLAVLAERMRRDKSLEIQLRHEISPADIAHTAQRANPPTDEVRLMVDRLRRDKAQLLAERAAIAAQARAQFAAQSDQAPGSAATVRSIDRQLAAIDASLDQLGDLLRPGAAGQADRRTRAASLAVAQDRFDLIQAVIDDAGVPSAADRVRRTNPQFDPVDTPGGGRVIITVVSTKR